MKKTIFALLIALFAVCTVSAQDKGHWGVSPKIGIYTNTGAQGAIFGLGVSGKYSITDNWRIEPGITALFKTGCSVDVGLDVQYLFRIADEWSVYPLAGISANDIGGWSAGVNIGGGADFAVARDWDISAGIKWMIQTASGHHNPIIINIGTTYKF